MFFHINVSGMESQVINGDKKETQNIFFCLVEVYYNSSCSYYFWHYFSKIYQDLVKEHVYFPTIR